MLQLLHTLLACRAMREHGEARLSAAHREKIKSFYTYAMVDLTNVVQFKVCCAPIRKPA